MNLVELYITEIGKNLPQKQRVDIQEEIRSALQDMLDDRSQQSGRPVDDDLVIEVLKEYGSPEKVAASYLPERYLISPRLFPAFLKTIRIVLPIVGALALIGLGLSLSKTPLNAESLFETILQAIAELFSAAVTVLGYIVLVFAILEWVMPNLKEKHRPWDPRTLARIFPPDRVGIAEPISEIVFNFAALVIFNFYPQIIGAAYVSGQGWTFTQVLSEAFFRYLPMLSLLWALKIVLNFLLLRRSQWQTGTRWFSLGLQALEVGIASAMLRGPSLVALTAQELSAAGPFQPEAARVLVELLNQVVTWALIIVIVLGIVEMVKTILRLLGNKKPVVLILENK